MVKTREVLVIFLIAALCGAVAGLSYITWEKDTPTPVGAPKDTAGWVKALVAYSDEVSADVVKTDDGKTFDCLTSRSHKDELTVIRLCTMRGSP